jgi:hypothetical protein
VTPKKNRQKREREDYEKSYTEERKERYLEERRERYAEERRERYVEERRERYVEERSRRQHKERRRRVVSGALLEEAQGEKLRSLRGGTYNHEKDDEEEENFLKRRKRLCSLSVPINPEGLMLTQLIRDWHCHFRSAFSDYNTCCSGGFQEE